MLKKAAVLIFALMVPLSAGAVTAINPATDEKDLIIIPAEKERNMGKKLHKKIQKHFDLPVDPLMQERITKIGERLSRGSDRKDIVYRFTVLNAEEEDFYNAFAAPGGYVYIFDDLVEVLGTDDNVAAVLAHEMGHVEARHSVKRAQANIGITALMLVGAQMKSEKGTYSKATEAVGQLMAAYSRNDEKEADELSVKYMELAEFDAEGAVEALKTLKALRKKAPRRKYSIYKSHPYLSERIAHIKNFIKGSSSFDTYINLTEGENEL